MKEGGLGLATLARYSIYYSLKEVLPSIDQCCPVLLVGHHTTPLLVVVVFMEEVSAGEQRRGTGLPTKQSSLFCLAFGCCTEYCMHHTTSGLSWLLMLYCRMNHTAEWKDARGGYSHPASCLHCFHGGHIHLPHDNLVIIIFLCEELYL